MINDTHDAPWIVWPSYGHHSHAEEHQHEQSQSSSWMFILKNNGAPHSCHTWGNPMGLARNRTFLQLGSKRLNLWSIGWIFRPSISKIQGCLLWTSKKLLRISVWSLCPFVLDLSGSFWGIVFLLRPFVLSFPIREVLRIGWWLPRRSCSHANGRCCRFLLLWQLEIR